MSFTKLVFIFALFLLFLGCEPSIRVTLTPVMAAPLSPDAEVLVLNTEQPAPDSTTLIGTIKIGDNGFSTDCGYDKVIEYAKSRARLAGGNIVKITELTPPGASSCYRINANILYRQNIQTLMNKICNAQDSITKTKFNGDTNYAILYIYRPKNYTGSLIIYRVHIKDSVIWVAKNNSKTEIKLFKKGKTILRAHTEVADSVALNVKFGCEYYVRCTVDMGILVGRPNLFLMPTFAGRAEYNTTDLKK